MEPILVLKPALAAQFCSALDHYRVIFFSAPCGFGKTTAAQLLLSGKKTLWLNAEDPALRLDVENDSWDALVLDNFSELSVDMQQPLCDLIRSTVGRPIVCLSRGKVPSWLLPFQVSGIMTVLDQNALAFDRQSVGQLLEHHGLKVNDLMLTAIYKESRGYPLALSILARHMVNGESFDATIADQIRQEIFLYYEEEVFNRFDLTTRRLLLELAPFDQFSLSLAHMVSGDSNVGETFGRLQRETTMMIQDSLDVFHFWPIFRLFLRWELRQKYSDEQCRAIYNRGGLYYELKEDYGHALQCYAKSGDHSKVSELLEKNAMLHPGMGHYYEMERYYRDLPENEILNSPALMQSMSMLEAINMDYEASERWYQALQEFADCRSKNDAAGREARGRLAWLEIGLPQRSTVSLLKTIPAVFRLIANREIELPPFSVTSALPSIMNGGKDFSDWSKKDDLLYKTLRLPVEAVLGKDGIGLPDLAVAESKFEKGEDITARMFSIMAHLNEIQHKGTADIEFAMAGLLVRSQVAAGHAYDAAETLTTLREQFVARGRERFLPNLDALRCRVDLRLRDDDAVEQWYREKAPKDRLHFQVMKRYQYFTQAMVELSRGEAREALLTLAPLQYYCRVCSRHIDGIHLNVLTAIAQYRLRDDTWQETLRAALDEAYEYSFVRTISVYGVAVLPLLEACGWEKESAFLNVLIDDARDQAAAYPDFLEPHLDMTAPLSNTELQVLRLICADKSNAEIGAILGIRLATVKTHVSHILQKLGVKRRSEAKTMAEKLHLL